jgi:hypothetical protein
MLPFAAVLVALAPSPFRLLTGLEIAFSVAAVIIATATMPNAPEGVHDPLGELWLPRFLGRYLAETTAWLHWGLHGIQPLLLLLGAAAAALLAFFATTRRTPAARRLVVVLTTALAVLAVSLIAPLDLPASLRLNGIAAASADVRIIIADAGVTRTLVADDRRRVVPWAQLENQGAPVEHTMVKFAIHAPSGEEIWSAWQSEVNWRKGERKYLDVDWPLDDAAPGNYRLSVVVTSGSDQMTLAHIDDAGSVRVPFRGEHHD